MDDTMSSLIEACNRLVREWRPLPCPHCGVSLMAHTDPGVYVRCEMRKMSYGVTSPRVTGKVT